LPAQKARPRPLTTSTVTSFMAATRSSPSEGGGELAVQRVQRIGAGQRQPGHAVTGLELDHERELRRLSTVMTAPAAAPARTPAAVMAGQKLVRKKGSA